MAVSDITRMELSRLQSGQHHSITLPHAKLGDDDLYALAEHLSTNPHIYSIYLTGNRFSAEAIEHFSDALLRRNSRNLIAIDLPSAPPELESFVEANAKRASHLQSLSQKAPEKMSGAELRETTARSGAIRHMISQYRIMWSFDRFHHGLPRAPQPDAENLAEVLFVEDANSFAPLDNPTLWNFGDNPARKALDALPLSRELLTRQTVKGSTLLDAAAFAWPDGSITSYLNSQGIRIRAGDLLTPDNTPSPLLNTLMEKENGLKHLFTPQNWQGKPEEALRVHRALPRQVQETIPIRALHQAIRPIAPSGHGR